MVDGAEKPVAAVVEIRDGRSALGGSGEDGAGGETGWAPIAERGVRAGVGRALDVSYIVIHDRDGGIGWGGGFGELAAIVVLEAGDETARIGVIGHVAEGGVDEAFAAQAVRVRDAA